MKKFLMSVIVMWMTGGAYAAELFSDLAVKAADLKDMAAISKGYMEPVTPTVMAPTFENLAPSQNDAKQITLQDIRDTRREICRMDFKQLTPSEQIKASDLLHKFSMEVLRAEAALLKTGEAELNPEYLNKKVNPRLVKLRKMELKAKNNFLTTENNDFLEELHNISIAIFKMHMEEQTFVIS
ncbi:MAG: hypothetical protein A2X28_03970 [Elusimicrobia bacterium GWA2_56_46]|nr:MAG: hypothetical protein A2X28_03970 [Elusimicrobia bacterium GWA2_56_46]OGR55030.1 MAG: hypothetical protein A2X39_02905 [Elusimicrobia bacterium GWC2_56_31]HBB67217.1 hypothetical protein [Elusimicrobiota bacterium]HBW23955.1 hypothetical protein [Elusimicrobiota bacterium]